MALSIKYLFLLTTIIYSGLIISCQNGNTHQLNKIDNGIYIEPTNKKYPLVCYLYNDSIGLYRSGYREYLKLRENKILYQGYQDSGYLSKIECKELLNIDSLEIANYVPCENNRNCHVFNLKIIEHKAIIYLYWPYDIKGSYEFTLKDYEVNWIICILKKLSDQNDHVFETTDITAGAMSIYLYSYYEKSKRTDYYGNLNDGPISFFILHDLIQYIINQHINDIKKINSKMSLLDIRERFNSYAIKTPHTGFILEDEERMNMILDSLKNEYDQKKRLNEE